MTVITPGEVIKMREELAELDLYLKAQIVNFEAVLCSLDCRMEFRAHFPRGEGCSVGFVMVADKWRLVLLRKGEKIPLVDLPQADDRVRAVQLLPSLVHMIPFELQQQLKRFQRAITTTKELCDLMHKNT